MREKNPISMQDLLVDQYIGQQKLVHRYIEPVKTLINIRLTMPILLDEVQANNWVEDFSEVLIKHDLLTDEDRDRVFTVVRNFESKNPKLFPPSNSDEETPVEQKEEESLPVQIPKSNIFDDNRMREFLNWAVPANVMFPTMELYRFLQSHPEYLDEKSSEWPEKRDKILAGLTRHDFKKNAVLEKLADILNPSLEKPRRSDLIRSERYDKI